MICDNWCLATNLLRLFKAEEEQMHSGETKIAHTHWRIFDLIMSTTEPSQDQMEPLYLLD